MLPFVIVASLAAAAFPGGQPPVVTPNGSTLPWRNVGGVKVGHLVAEELEHEFAPGMKALVWGYNGGTPGPTIEAVEGDRVRIYVTNRLPEPTTVHWHGIVLPAGMDGVAAITQRAIEPGETFRYEFTFDRPGTFMYHPHYDEMTQIALGMVGMIVVHPRRPVGPPVDRDFVLMSHEWKLPVGARRPDPNAMSDFNLLTFNGKAYPGTEPLLVGKGERVRIRLGNLGPMDHHPVHLHGLAFEVTGTDGGTVPPSARFPETTVLVPVGATRTIEFVPTEAGDWPVHCQMTHHVMTRMGHLVNMQGDPRARRPGSGPRLRRTREDARRGGTARAPGRAGERAPVPDLLGDRAVPERIRRRCEDRRTAVSCRPGRAPMRALSLLILACVFSACANDEGSPDPAGAPASAPLLDLDPRPDVVRVELVAEIANVEMVPGQRTEVSSPWPGGGSSDGGGALPDRPSLPPQPAMAKPMIRTTVRRIRMSLPAGARARNLRVQRACRVEPALLALRARQAYASPCRFFVRGRRMRRCGALRRLAGGSAAAHDGRHETVGTGPGDARHPRGRGRDQANRRCVCAVRDRRPGACKVSRPAASPACPAGGDAWTGSRLF